MLREKLGFSIRGSTPSTTLDAIVRADSLGVNTAWSTIGGVSQDALTLFAAAAQRTRDIGFGTSIVPIFPRHPIVLASQVLVIADLAPGRFRLGIGPSHRPIVEDMYGISFTRPLAYLREYLAVLRQLLWNGRADFEGELLKVHHATLPSSIAPPRIPLLTSALRSSAFRLAGEVADGAISWVCPVPYLLQVALPALQSAAEQAERATPPLIAHVSVAVHRDRAAVHDAARASLGHYGRLPFYAHMFADAGYVLPQNGVLTGDLIDALVVSGSPQSIAARLGEILESGISELLLTLVPVVDAEAEEADLMSELYACTS